MMATPGRLETSQDARLDHEVALRRRGYVPMTAYDAPYPRFDTLLPACRVDQVVAGEQHGRLVWSHPGASGLDPRAAVPLAIVRVADGLGPDPLDPPVDLATAARELLDGDVGAWLMRSRHRVLAHAGDVACLYEVDVDRCRCFTHPVADPLLQQAADALGDVTYARCRPRRWRHPVCTQWGMPADKPHDLAELVRCALEATFRLGGWLRRGVSGATAWGLTRYGVTVEQLQQWQAAGFSTDDVPRWWELGGPEALSERRDAGESPYRPLALPPAPEPDPSRGLGGFARWKISCHQPQRYLRMVACELCGVRDDASPCRTCSAEGRTVRFESEWAEHVELAGLGPAYASGGAETPVACADTNCRTSLALSAAGVEEMQQ